MENRNDGKDFFHSIHKIHVNHLKFVSGRLKILFYIINNNYYIIIQL